MTRVIRPTTAAAFLLACSLTAGCGDGGSTSDAGGATEASTAATPGRTPTADRRTSAPPREPRAPRERAPLRGIDASHHQGAIDWPEVAADGIAFAYLKATEGTTYTDPTFAGHRAAATRVGIRVGGYHYFSLCSSGAEQAGHFAEVLGRLPRRTTLPPAVDLELVGSCDTPPDRDTLLAEVRAFLDVVAERTGREPVVYLYPDFEEVYGLAPDLADHRQWVRRLGDDPPVREWWIWQRDDAGTVDGIAGGVDINEMRP